VGSGLNVCAPIGAGDASKAVHCDAEKILGRRLLCLTTPKPYPQIVNLSTPSAPESSKPLETLEKVAVTVLNILSHFNPDSDCARLIQHSSILMAEQDFDVTTSEIGEAEGLEFEEDELDPKVEDFLDKPAESLEFFQSLSLAQEVIAMLSADLLGAGGPASVDDAMALGANLARLDAAAQLLADVEPVEFEQSEEGEDSDEAEQA
jgi:hypothetical protein